MEREQTQNISEACWNLESFTKEYFRAFEFPGPPWGQCCLPPGAVYGGRGRRGPRVAHSVVVPAEALSARGPLAIWPVLGKTVTFPLPHGAPWWGSETKPKLFSRRRHRPQRQNTALICLRSLKSEICQVLFSLGRRRSENKCQMPLYSESTVKSHAVLHASARVLGL